MDGGDRRLCHYAHTTSGVPAKMPLEYHASAFLTNGEVGLITPNTFQVHPLSSQVDVFVEC